MFKPNGNPAKNIDPLKLLNLWAHYLDQKKEPNKPAMIFAGLGKPTYFLNEDIANAAATYWQQYAHAVARIEKLITQPPFLNPEQQCEEIVRAATAIDYGLPAGDHQAKTTMAKALSKWYEIEIKPDEIIFTVGGSSALRMIFAIINARNPNGKIITPRPYYPYYNNAIHHNNFHFIDVMNEPGYRLTARAVQENISAVNNQSESNGQAISAFLFCDPNNPVGSVIGKEEWHNIAQVLKTTSADIPIIVDEAYAEMVFNAKHDSLLTIAPELKNRLIILRSATKGLSASGERMAVLICFNELWLSELTDEVLLSYAHAPRSLQHAYAQAMLSFSDKKRQALTQYYRIQTELVHARLKTMHAQMPDDLYTIEGTFYVLADLSDLFGTEIPDAATQALGKKNKSTITTDVEICYSLLFRDRLMISPLSFFGVDPHLGYVRITCSNGFTQITEMMNRIEYRLNEARAAKVKK